MSITEALRPGPAGLSNTRRAGSALPPMPRGWTSSDGVPADRAVNQVIVASDAPLTEPRLNRSDGVWVTGDALEDYVGDAMVLTDDHAPVDQLVLR